MSSDATSPDAPTPLETGTQSTTDSLATGTRLQPADPKMPLALPAAAFTGPLIAVVVLAAGVVGIRDGILAAGWITGTSWTVTAAEWIDGLAFAGWMVPVAIAAIIIGLLLLLAALRPRRKTAVELTAQTSVWIEPAAIAQIAADVARSVPGVLGARATASRRGVTIRAQVTGDDRSGIGDTIAEQVKIALEPVQKAPKITVRSRVGGRR